jgi:hypothetical protein
MLHAEPAEVFAEEEVAKREISLRQSWAWQAGHLTDSSSSDRQSRSNSAPHFSHRNS